MVLKLTIEEVKQAVADWINASGKYNGQVRPEQINVTKHVEGQYEESVEVLDGLSVDLSQNSEPLPKPKKGK